MVKKLSLVHVEVIDRRLLSSGDVTYETIHLEVKVGNHSSSIVFSIIRIPLALVILDFLG